jgi:hypothetical protein
MVVCGYKPELWPFTLERVRLYVDLNHVDVVIIAPGVNNLELDLIAAANGWSYLRTLSNKLSLAQNLVLATFKKASWVYKIDEDIFINSYFIDGLFNCYNFVLSEGKYLPGMIVPKLNVNGFSYLRILDQCKKTDEYFEKFQEIKSACTNVKIHYSAEAAKYLWDLTFAFDLLSKQPSSFCEYVTIPHRFSIGAFLVKRELIENMGFFNVTFDGVLGEEEVQICNFCQSNSFPIIMADSVFAGHFAFGPQHSEMLKYLVSNKSKFSL